MNVPILITVIILSIILAIIVYHITERYKVQTVITEIIVIIISILLSWIKLDDNEIKYTSNLITTTVDSLEEIQESSIEMTTTTMLSEIDTPTSYENTTTNYTTEKNFEGIDEKTNNWSIEIINEVDSSIQIGSDMTVDLAICTPPSQYSTPYILYAGYFDRNIWNSVQFFALKIPSEQSHVNLKIDTYLLGLPKGDYIFSFDLFRAEDYSFGNSCASAGVQVKLLGENVTFEDDVFDRNVVKHEFLDYYIIQDEKYPEDTEKLSLINVSNTDIKTIAYLSNLKELDITGSDITDIEPLKKLKKLESFSVHSNNLSNISVVENMPYLEHLSIGGENYNGIGTHGVLEDISSIQNLKLLTTLTIYDCNVKDISYIENLKMLEYISIFKTKVDDISALTDLRFVKELKLHANNIKDITPLNNIPNLTRLVISNNNLSEEQINEFKESHPDCSVYSKD